MGLVVRILIELALAPVLLFFALWFWQAFHRKRYIRRLAQDQKTLDEFVQALNSESPFSERAAILEPVNGNWALNMLLVTKSDQQAIGTVQVISVLVCAAVVVGSFFLGPVFLAANLGLALLPALIGAGAATKNSALGEILSMALIIYRWKQADPESYRRFLLEAVGIHKLDSAVERLAT